MSVPWYRRPLSAVVNPLTEVGFILDRILEPVPTSEFKEAPPEEYERHVHEPTFIHISAKKL